MSRSVIVYTLPTCTWCDVAKRMLENAGIAYEAVDLKTGGTALRDEFNRRTDNAKTVPQVVLVAGEETRCIGGSDSLDAETLHQIRQFLSGEVDL